MAGRLQKNAGELGRRIQVRVLDQARGQLQNVFVHQGQQACADHGHQRTFEGLKVGHVAYRVEALGRHALVLFGLELGLGLLAGFAGLFRRDHAVPVQDPSSTFTHHHLGLHEDQ